MWSSNNFGSPTQDNLKLRGVRFHNFDRPEPGPRPDLRFGSRGSLGSSLSWTRVAFLLIVLFGGVLLLYSVLKLLPESWLSLDDDDANSTPTWKIRPISASPSRKIFTRPEQPQDDAAFVKSNASASSRRLDSLEPSIHVDPPPDLALNTISSSCTSRSCACSVCTVSFASSFAASTPCLEIIECSSSDSSLLAWLWHLSSRALYKKWIETIGIDSCSPKLVLDFVVDDFERALVFGQLRDSFFELVDFCLIVCDELIVLGRSGRFLRFIHPRFPLCKTVNNVTARDSVTVSISFSCCAVRFLRSSISSSSFPRGTACSLCRAARTFPSIRPTSRRDC